MNKSINNVVELTEKELACVCGGVRFVPPADGLILPPKDELYLPPSCLPPPPFIYDEEQHYPFDC